MPKIYEFGLPGFLPGMPETDCIGKFHVQPRGCNALITGENGIGKTAHVIDPWMYLLRMHGKTDRKTNFPAYMHDHNARSPYVYYVDMLIDGEGVDKNMDMLLAGFYIDVPTANDAGEYKENGFHFVVQHSSDVWRDLADARPVYEKLGIDIVEHSPSNPNMVRIASREAARAAFGRETPHMIGRTFNIKAGRPTPGFLPYLSELARYDFASAREQAVHLSTSEGSANLQSLSEEALLTYFLYNPFEHEFLPKGTSSELLEQLADYCEGNLDAAARHERISFLESSVGDLEQIQVLAENAEAAENALKQSAGAAQKLACDIQSGRNRTTREIEDLENEITCNAAQQLEAGKHSASLSYRRAQKNLVELDEKRKSLVLAATAARKRFEQAARKAGLAAAMNALAKESDAKETLIGIENALLALESERAKSGLGDIRWTLKVLNDREIEKCEEYLAAAKSQADAADEALSAADEALSDATLAVTSSELKLGNCEETHSRTLHEIKESLRLAEVDNVVNEFQSVLWDEVEAVRERHAAAAKAARKDEEKAEDALAAARGNILQLQAARVDLSTEHRAAESALEQTAATAKALDLGIDELLAEHGSTVNGGSLETLEGCERAERALDERCAEGGAKAAAARTAADKARKYLHNAENGSLMLPDGVVAALDAAGIHSQPAIQLISEMSQETRERLLRRSPAACACVVVQDGQGQKALDALASMDNEEWLAGAVGVLEQGQMIRPESIDTAMFAAHPDYDYIADPAARLRALNQEAEALEGEAETAQREADALFAAKTAVLNFREKWYSGSYARREDYVAAIITSENRVEAAKAALDDNLEQEDAAQALVKELDRARTEASKHAEGIERLIEHLSAATGRKGELERARAAVEDTKSALAAAELSKSAAVGERDACAAEQKQKRTERNNRETALRNARNKLHYIALPEGGSFIEGVSFEALLEQEKSISKTLSQNDGRLDSLRAEREDASKKLEELASVSNLKLAAACASREETEAKAFALDELELLENDKQAALEEKNMAETRESYASSNVDRAQGQLTNQYQTYVSRYKEDPLPETKIMGDPEGVRARLEKEAEELSSSKRSLERVLRVFDECFTNLACKGFSAGETGEGDSREEVDPKQAGALVDAALKKVDDARNNLDVRTNALTSRLNSYNSGVRQREEELSFALLSPREGSVPKAHEVQSMLQSVKGTLLALRSKDDSSQLARQVACRKLTLIGGDVIKKMSAIERRANGEFGFYGLSKAAALDADEWEKAVDGWLALKLATIGSLAKKQTDRMTRDEFIRKHIKDDILSIRNLVELCIGQTGTDTKDGRIWIKSPRKSEQKRVTWKQLKTSSGGERLSARMRVIVPLVSANCLNKGATSIIMLDTLFGGLSGEALLAPTFDVMERSKTQLIVVEDRVLDAHINARFPHITKIQDGVCANGAIPLCETQDGKTGVEEMTAFFTATGREVQDALF